MTDRSFDTIWMTPYVPDDPAVLKAIAEITLRHSHLDHMLRMMIKSLTNVDVRTAVSATRRQGSAILRRRIHKLAKQSIVDGNVLIRLEDILNRCERITEKRNRLTHNIWAQETGGNTQKVQNDDLQWEDPPELKELLQLASELKSIQYEMNEARLNGWLRVALTKAENRN